MSDDRKYDREAFDEMAKRLDAGEELTLEMVGDVFLKDFWMMLIMCFMDSNDAARAIQGAIGRLSGKAARKVRK